eukprot:g7784.t1
MSKITRSLSTDLIPSLEPLCPGLVACIYCGWVVMSFLSKVGAGLSSAAEATKKATLSAADSTTRGTKKLLVKNKISSRKGYIKQRKQVFGEEIYEAFQQDNKEEQAKLYAECEADVKTLESQILAMEAVVQQLESGIDVDTSKLDKENPIPVGCKPTKRSSPNVSPVKTGAGAILNNTYPSHTI